MPELNPLLAIMHGEHSFVGESLDMESKILPIPEQSALVPGDRALLGTSSAPVESDFGLVEVLDASQYAETYPDWEERVLLSYVLCRHFSSEDPEFTLGWWHRVKLMPVAVVYYNEALEWMKTGFPENPPEWVNDSWTNYAGKLSVLMPDRVPAPLFCPQCESSHINLDVRWVITKSARAGKVTTDDKENYIQVSDCDQQVVSSAQLNCESCGAYAVLDDGDWHVHYEE